MGEPFACWCDVETTGLAIDADILEVGLRVTDSDLTTLAERSWVLPYTSAEITEMKTSMPEVVREMHAANHLLIDCFTNIECKSLYLGRMAIWREILAWITGHAKGLPMAGSTVRADRAWLTYRIPELADLLHYRSIDVSSLWILAQAWRPDVTAAAPEAAKRHRVMPDLDDSIALLAYLRDALGIGPVA